VPCVANDNCSSPDPCYLAYCNITLGTCYTQPLLSPYPYSFCYTQQCVSGTYILNNVSCPVFDPCFVYSCNATLNTCQSSPSPNASTSCFQKFNCNLNASFCVPPSACFNASCLPNGTCVIQSNVTCNTTNLCNPSVCLNGVCVTNATVCPNQTSVCVNPGSCNSSTGQCQYTPISCPTDNCTLTRCDPTLGCLNVSKDASVVCDDGNACTNDLCNPTSGCYHNPVVCPNGPNCTVSYCDLNRGCEQVPVVCNSSNTNLTSVKNLPLVNGTNSSCILMACQNTTNQCVASVVKCNLNLGAIIGALAAGIIVAIILAILIAAALAGGAAYAVNGQIHQQREAEVLNNPLYVDSGKAGDNPLFKHCDL